jgi:hypothetical protein
VLLDRSWFAGTSQHARPQKSKPQVCKGTHKRGTPTTAKAAIAVAPAPARPALGASTVRKNAETKFRECLEVAIKERPDLKEQLGDAASIAHDIEIACHKQTGASSVLLFYLSPPTTHCPRRMHHQTSSPCQNACCVPGAEILAFLPQRFAPITFHHHANAGGGHDISKEYRAKFRSLYHGLKAANNPELRCRVLTQDVTPEQLVSMNVAELSSQNESKWRQTMLEKQNKMTVLDVEAAASFSTAANQALRRKEVEQREVGSMVVHFPSSPRQSLGFQDSCFGMRAKIWQTGTPTCAALQYRVMTSLWFLRMCCCPNSLVYSDFGTGQCGTLAALLLWLIVALVSVLPAAWRS